MSESLINKTARKLIQERMEEIQHQYSQVNKNLLADAAKDLIFAGFAINDVEANFHIASACARLLIWLNEDY